MASRTSTEIQITSPTGCIVSLHGVHDASSRLGVTLTLAAVGGYRNVLVDLGDCTFGDGSLELALRLASRRTREDGGALELVVPRAATAVRRALEGADLHRVLPFHETRAAGIASISAAEQLDGHHEPGSLTTVSARIDRLEARTESGRARELRRSRPGVTVVSAQIVPAPAWSAAPADEGTGRSAG